MNALALTRNGRRLFSAGDDRQIVVWDFGSGQPERRLTGDERQIPALRLNPDGRLIAVGSTNGSVYLVSAETGEVVRQLASPEAPSGQ